MENKSREFEKIHKKILSLGEEIINRVTDAINEDVKKSGTLNHYKVVWNQLESHAAPVIEDILKTHFSDCKITIAKSKSTYPDVKMQFKDFVFGVDVKSNESSKQPWFDVGRLDTFETKRLKKYDEEYDLVIKYDSNTGKLIEMFFDIQRAIIGINKECNGVKFRDYDGKLRPKSWNDFGQKKVYWYTKEDFLDGINKSRKYRQRLLTKAHYNTLSDSEKTEFKKLFE